MPWTPQTLIAAASCPDSCIPTGMQTAAVIVQFMEAAGMTNADIKALMAKAACVDSCIPRGMQTAVLISLIQTVSGDTSTPAQLMERAKCLYGCIPTGMLMPVLTALGAAGPGGDCDFQEGIGSPVGVATPDFVGQLYHDTVADAYYRSTGLTNADWTLIAGGGGGDGLVWGPNATTLDSINLTLPTFGVAETTYSFPTLTTVGTDFYAYSCTSLTTLDVGALTTVGGSFYASSCTLLTSVLCGTWVPTDGTTILFDGCALTATSVQLILRRLVLAGVTTCTINLSGGTNAGTASLNAQGQADVVTLGAQLTINP